LVAKDAARSVRNERYGGGVFPADIETETDDSGRLVCRPRAEPAEPFPPVAVTIVNGKVAAFAAFAQQVGIALVPVAKDEPEREVRARAARMAVADALRISPEGLPVELGPLAGVMLVAHAGKRLRVQTARRKDLIVATTVCETE
jgi:hypothetical protein